MFSGTKSIGHAFAESGHEVLSVEWNTSFEADMHADIEKLDAKTIINTFGCPDVIWASPDCTTFSIAAISHHRIKNENTGSLIAKSDYAKKCDRVDLNMIRLIRDLNPRYWFIENPRGGECDE